MMFIGRSQELSKLNKLMKSDYAGMGLIYGRRRVGKSELVRNRVSPVSITNASRLLRRATFEVSAK